MQAPQAPQLLASSSAEEGSERCTAARADYHCNATHFPTIAVRLPFQSFHSLMDLLPIIEMLKRMPSQLSFLTFFLIVLHDRCLIICLSVLAFILTCPLFYLKPNARRQSAKRMYAASGPSAMEIAIGGSDSSEGEAIDSTAYPVISLTEPGSAEDHALTLHANP